MREITQHRRAADNVQRAVPTTAFSQARAGLDIKEVSGQAVYELRLGAPRRISRWCLRSYWPKRKGFHPHLGNPLRSHLFSISLPKSEDLPFYT